MPNHAAIQGQASLFEDFVKSEGDFRDFRAMEKQTSQMWMRFWLRQMHKHGLSNTEIGRRLNLSESTVRYHLKKV